MSEWRNRIAGVGELKVAGALFNPRNWRVHPQGQQDALAEMLDTVGWVQNVIVNKTTGNLVDGHLRVLLADRRGEETVPSLLVELTEEEERLIIATLDPIGAMAVADMGKLSELIEELGPQSENLQAMLDSLVLGKLPEPPADLSAYDKDAGRRYECPKCGFVWGGNDGGVAE